MGNNMFFSAVSLEYADLFWLNFLQNIQHLAWKIPDPTVEFWQKIICLKYPATLTMGVTSSTYIDFKEVKRCKVASCHKTEPADDIE